MQNESVYYTTDKFQNYTDEQLISQIREGNEQALTYLLNRYKPLVNHKVSKYFMMRSKIVLKHLLIFVWKDN